MAHPQRASQKPLPRSFACIASTLILALIVAAAGVVGDGGDRGGVALAQTAELEAYTRIARWPERTAGGRAAIDDPVGLEVASDGRVFIADRGVGGVLTMLPDGTFLPPFGAVGDGPDSLGGVGPLALDEAADRLYVLDTGGQRVAIFRLDGTYVEEWKALDGAAIAMGPDGRVYVADRETNEIAALAPDGTPLFRFGGHGTAEGRFTLMAAVSVSPDGQTVAVGDLNRLRVQLFDLRPDGADFRRAYALQHPKYSPTVGPPFQQCRAGVVHALGGDAVWVGDGTGACHIEPGAFQHMIAISAAGGTICKPTVRVPLVRPHLGQYYAVVDYNPNFGPCWSIRSGKETALSTTPAVVRYTSMKMARAEDIFLSAVNARDDGGLVAPRMVSVPAPETVFVLDSTRTGRYFQPDGAPLKTLGLTTKAGSGATFRTRIEIADGSDSVEALFGYYRKERRGPLVGEQDVRATAVSGTATPQPNPRESALNWVEDEHGIGLFLSTEAELYGQRLQVLDPVWTNRFSTLSETRNIQLGRQNANNLTIVDMAWSAGHDHVFVLAYERAEVTRKDYSQLILVPVDGTRRFGRWDLPDDTSGTYTINPYIDLSVGPDGRVLVLDDVRDEVVVFGADGSELPPIPVADDVRAIAGGVGHLFGLRESGYVERYAPDGTVTARFDGRPFSATDPQTLSGIAADEVGRVYVADAQGSVVAVFEPAPPGSDVLPVPSDATCVLQGDKTARPTELDQGETTTVSMAIDGLCGIGEAPTDIMIVTLFYPSIAVPDPAEDTIRELRRLVSRIDLEKHRVGIVAYFRDARVEQPLTQDRAALLAKIPRIARRWANSCHIRHGRPRCARAYPILREGMKVGARALHEQGNDGRRKVMVVYHADYCNRDFEYRDGDCVGYPDASLTAKSIRESGVQVVVHDGNRTGWRRYRFDGGPYQLDAQPLASSDADVTFDWAALQHRMVNYQIPDALATNLTLVDTLPANMRLVPGSVSAGGAVAGADMTWTMANLPYGSTRFDLAVEPLALGRHPTNVRAEATFIDGWGRPGSILFPVPYVTVREPPPTPVPTPSATSEPTPAPTLPSTDPTPIPRPVYLPLAMREHCLPGTLRFDVAIVLDSSSSMEGAKLQASIDAVGTFFEVLELAPGADVVALVAFDQNARVIHDLSSDAASLRAALSALDTRPGTRIDVGLASALDLLAAIPPSARRQPLVVLLSDGRQDDVAPVLAQGDRARVAGVDVFTIGLGDDVDEVVLERIATSAAHAFLAPTEDDLRAIYAEVARTIPCR